jgi:hypothetical protein
VVKGVEVVEVIEGTSLPLLDHLDTLDILDHLCPNDPDDRSASPDGAATTRANRWRESSLARLPRQRQAARDALRQGVIAQVAGGLNRSSSVGSARWKAFTSN